MKQFFTSIFILSFFVAFAQEDSIIKAQKLIEEKQYNSAYLLLDEVDPENQKPEIVLEKTRILLDYFVSSLMHQLFALKDLEEDEELMDIRGSEGLYSMYKFYPDSVLYTLIEQHPDNFKLRKMLGYYYHELHLKYTGRWLIEDSELIKKFAKNYKLAYENGVYDDWSLYGIGYAHLHSQEYQESIKYFEESIKLKPENPSTHYNLAYAHLYVDDRKNAIEYAKNALELYDYPDYKSDAAKMIGIIYAELGDFENALKYHKQANAITANNYYVLKPLLNLEVKTNDENYSKRTIEFFLIAPDNPTIYNNLEEIYYSHGKADELLEFYKNQKADFTNDLKVTGNLSFYIGKIYMTKNEIEEAKSNLLKAKEVFQKLYEPDHPVFGMIDSFLSEKQEQYKTVNKPDKE